jgi:hypothetical protein
MNPDESRAGGAMGLAAVGEPPLQAAALASRLALAATKIIGRRMLISPPPGLKVARSDCI